MQDSFGREIDYMRVSVTDRCNLRCVYCMPEHGIQSIPHSSILRFEEITDIVRAAAELGIKKIKLTGGEPLVRKGVLSLARELKNIRGIEKVTLTTNGILIGRYKKELAESGIDGVNISMDTLRKDRFEKITRCGCLEKTLKAIDITYELGINTKINCVALKDFNDDEFCDIARLAEKRKICVRFIEIMPIGLGKGMKAVSGGEIYKKLESGFGELLPDRSPHGNGPASYFKPRGFEGSIGFISAVSDCFCGNCNRIRLTADGCLKPCLQYSGSTDIKEILRGGATREELAGAIRQAILAKPQRHSFGKSEAAKNIERKNMSQIGG